MVDSEEQLAGEVKKVYKINHQEKYGFHGRTTIWVAVQRETEDRIFGRMIGPLEGIPKEEVVVVKDNVANWTEDKDAYHRYEITERAKNQ